MRLERMTRHSRVDKSPAVIRRGTFNDVEISSWSARDRIIPAVSNPAVEVSSVKGLKVLIERHEIALLPVFLWYLGKGPPPPTKEIPEMTKHEEYSVADHCYSRHPQRGLLKVLIIKLNLRLKGPQNVRITRTAGDRRCKDVRRRCNEAISLQHGVQERTRRSLRKRTDITYRGRLLALLRPGFGGTCFLYCHCVASCAASHPSARNWVS